MRGRVRRHGHGPLGPVGASRGGSTHTPDPHAFGLVTLPCQGAMRPSPRPRGAWAPQTVTTGCVPGAAAHGHAAHHYCLSLPAFSQPPCLLRAWRCRLGRRRWWRRVVQVLALDHRAPEWGVMLQPPQVQQ